MKRVALIWAGRQMKRRKSPLPFFSFFFYSIFHYCTLRTYWHLLLAAWPLVCLTIYTKMHMSPLLLQYTITHTESVHTFNFIHKETKVHILRHTQRSTALRLQCCHYLQHWTLNSLPLPLCVSPHPSWISHFLFFLSDWLLYTFCSAHLLIFHSFPCSFSLVIYSLWLRLLSLSPPACPSSSLSLTDFPFLSQLLTFTPEWLSCAERIT